MAISEKNCQVPLFLFIKQGRYSEVEAPAFIWLGNLTRMTARSVAYRSQVAEVTPNVFRITGLATLVKVEDDHVPRNRARMRAVVKRLKCDFRLHFLRN